MVTIFSQFGEPVHINLVRDKETGKSRGFAFLKYEDQRSTDLAVDNLSGATVLGRLLRVDHMRYKKRDDEEKEEDNVARMIGGGDSKGGGDDDGGNRYRGRRRGSDADEVQRRPLLKEEIELTDLVHNHDEEDPMKEFLIEEKKEQVALALERVKIEENRSSRRRDDGGHRSSRHHRHHRYHRHHRRHTSPSRERRASYRDESPPSRRYKSRPQSQSGSRSQDDSR